MTSPWKKGQATHSDCVKAYEAEYVSERAGRQAKFKAAVEEAVARVNHDDNRTKVFLGVMVDDEGGTEVIMGGSPTQKNLEGLIGMMPQVLARLVTEVCNDDEG